MMSVDPFSDEASSSSNDADLWGNLGGNDKKKEKEGKPAAEKKVVEPGKGPVLPDLPHRDWVLRMIRQRYLQAEKLQGDTTATLSNAPTAEEIVADLLAWQVNTNDRYGNLLPKENGTVTKAKGLKALTGKAKKKTKDDGSIDNLDRDCVEAYLESLLKAGNQDVRYEELRAEFFSRKPSPTPCERKAAKAKTLTPTASATQSTSMNWTVVVCFAIGCLALLIALWMLKR